MFPNAMKGLGDYQEFHRWFDQRQGWDDENLSHVLLLLVEEVGEVAQVLKKVRWRAESEGEPAALDEFRADLGAELADCLAYLLKVSSRAGIDLEAAYLAKMEKNLSRTWAPPPNKG
jgi:NTP pyrophosphatase (non-canonical NTP hydrolase)